MLDTYANQVILISKGIKQLHKQLSLILKSLKIQWFLPDLLLNCVRRANKIRER
jgi:hypothetical protein